MSTDLVPAAVSPFDGIRRTRPDGTEYWSARDLQPLMGYTEWRNLQTAIDRARAAIHNTNGEDALSSHVVDATTLVPRPQGGAIAKEDIELSRYAAYLTAINGDPEKPETAAAQAYFAIRTREAETAAALDLSDPLAAIEAANARSQQAVEIAKTERAARIEAEAHAKALEAPASAWSHMAESSGDYEVADAAKVLSRDPNISIGRDRLFRFMQTEGWVYRNQNGRWKAYQTQVDCGRLTEKLGRPFLHEPSGEMRLPDPTIRITAKGLAELHKRLGGSGQSPLVAAS